MTEQIKVLRKDLISKLAIAKSNYVSLFGVYIKRASLLEALKLQDQPDAEFITIQYGNVSWKDAYKNPAETNWHTSEVLNSPCIQILCNHTIMRFNALTNVINRERHFTPIALQFMDYREKPVTNTGVIIDLVGLLKGLQLTLKHSATEENRIALYHILFEGKANKLILTGADGYRLANVPLEAKGIKELKQAIHRNDCANLIKFLKTIKPEVYKKQKSYPELYLTQGDDSLTFSCNNDLITLPFNKEVEYINISSILKYEGNSITCITSELFQACNALSAVSKDSGNIIRMQFYKVENIGKAILSARTNTHDGDAISKIELKAKVTADCKIGIDARYLRDALRLITDNTVELFIKHYTEQLTIKLQNGTIIAIMPIFVQWEDK